MENAYSVMPVEGVLTSRIGSALGLEPPAARVRWQELNRFLHAGLETGIACSPPKRLDDAWHAVLEHDDGAYERYCVSRFGHKVEHHEQDQPVSTGFDVLRAHAASRFGALDSVIWDTSAGLGTCVPRIVAWPRHHQNGERLSPSSPRQSVLLREVSFLANPTF